MRKENVIIFGEYHLLDVQDSIDHAILDMITIEKALEAKGIRREKTLKRWRESILLALKTQTDTAKMETLEIIRAESEFKILVEKPIGKDGYHMGYRYTLMDTAQKMLERTGHEKLIKANKNANTWITNYFNSIKDAEPLERVFDHMRPNEERENDAMENIKSRLVRGDDIFIVAGSHHAKKYFEALKNGYDARYITTEEKHEILKPFFSETIIEIMETYKKLGVKEKSFLVVHAIG